MRARKFVVSLTLAASMLAGLVAGAGAAPDERANCVAKVFTIFAPTGELGAFVSEQAKDGGFGEVGAVASSDCGGR